ncbi:MAG: LysM peptidoglycan-binding domain-containing protein [Chlamydiota bacterium]|nr:LysM peptidoglycan-binding domain-containing protein [Chlamydiota bacterium]
MHLDPLKKLRKLSQLLIFSGTMNIIMLATLAYWHIKERPPTPVCERKPASYKPLEISTDNNAIINSLSGLPQEELIKALKNNTLVDNGYYIRDLALGVLTTHHYFDLDRALIGNTKPSQKRFLIYTDETGNKKELTVFSGLNEPHYAAIETFIKTEKWPLTSQGLFYQLQKEGSSSNKSLKYAFFITPEYMTIELLFKRAPQNISRDEILDVLLQGSWSMLANFSEKQRIAQDLSDEQRRTLLLNYIDKGSTCAATLFLKTDSVYAIKKLDDDHVVAILKLSTERTANAARFALATLASPRSDDVWKEASHRLYEFSGETKPEKFNRNQVLTRFLPLTVQEKEPVKQPPKNIIPKTINKKAIVKAPKPKTSNWKRAYTVMEGDSLWKISRMFKVDIQELKKHNNLKNDSLTPGSMIIVP